MRYSPSTPSQSNQSLTLFRMSSACAACPAIHSSHGGGPDRVRIASHADEVPLGHDPSTCTRILDRCTCSKPPSENVLARGEGAGCSRTLHSKFSKPLAEKLIKCMEQFGISTKRFTTVEDAAAYRDKVTVRESRKHFTPCHGSVCCPSDLCSA